MHKHAVALLVLSVAICGTQAFSSLSYQVNYKYEQPLVMKMGATREIDASLVVNTSSIREEGWDKGGRSASGYLVNFKLITLSPQFSIITMNETIVNNRSGLSSLTYDELANLTKLSANKTIVIPVRLRLQANYIGHATLEPSLKQFPNLIQPIIEPSNQKGSNLDIIVVQEAGVWGLVFKISVPLVIIISYINLGAQIDAENMKELVKRPKTLILGFLLTVFVMPIASWLAGKWLLGDQLLYRVGSFVYACGPAASASTLWTVMLKADKELSVGLQVISTFGALFTMPILLYFMDLALQAEQHGQHSIIKVPYLRLIQTLAVLMLALFIGWRFIGRHEKAQKISQKVFRPLTFAVLLFIIIFSTILYWFIYQMFDWTITLAAVAITLATYLITGLLGYLINCNLDHAIAIAIGSAYKNEGVAFAVLFVAFGQPDLYIAYVPCLTQVVITSLASYLAYCLLSLVNCVRRRGQLDPIRATASEDEPAGTSHEHEGAKKESRSGSKSSENGANEDEFIAMNVTDDPPR